MAEEWYYIAPPEVVWKHYGPGKHPSGSSQRAHAGGPAKRGESLAGRKELKGKRTRRKRKMSLGQRAQAADAAFKEADKKLADMKLGATGKVQRGELTRAEIMAQAKKVVHLEREAREAFRVWNKVEREKNLAARKKKGTKGKTWLQGGEGGMARKRKENDR